MFMWLLSHRMTTVRVWLAYGGKLAACSSCVYPQETWRHCILDCPAVQQVWRPVLRDMSSQTRDCYLPRGQFQGAMIQDQPMEVASMVIFAQGVHDSTTQPWSPERYQGQDVITFITAWFIWRTHCPHIFEGHIVPPAETVHNLWSEIIHTLQGRFDSSQGSSNKVQRQREAFLHIWR